MNYFLIYIFGKKRDFQIQIKFYIIIIPYLVLSGVLKIIKKAQIYKSTYKKTF